MFWKFKVETCKLMIYVSLCVNFYVCVNNLLKLCSILLIFSWYRTVFLSYNLPKSLPRKQTYLFLGCSLKINLDSSFAACFTNLACRNSFTENQSSISSLSASPRSENLLCSCGVCKWTNACYRGVVFFYECGVKTTSLVQFMCTKK